MFLLAAGTLGAGSAQLDGAAIGFGKVDLAAHVSVRPTSLQFGPDGRLYVGQVDGRINVYSVVRDGPNDFRVAATETIVKVATIPNHDDDGTPNPAVAGRLVTGLLVTGKPEHPVLFVTSSDPRGGMHIGDTGLDTNSGTVSRLRWNGSKWVHRLLVRGLPRSEEVHVTNGLALDPESDTLFVAQGGNTNMGAPSASLAYLPEYALSGAILSVDLAGLGQLPYDIPTLNDHTRPGPIDANDPFGGNDGRNQARIVPEGPVQVYSPGFRNPFDLVLASNGRLYATDNGPNAGAGGLPVEEGPAGICTDEPSEPGESRPDSLHLVQGPGDYNGAPNPTRANTANVWGGQSPVPAGNPVECAFLDPGPERGSLATFAESTNGIAEYTASNFAGAMTGELLVATLLDNRVSRIQLTPDGTAVTSVDTLFSTAAKKPLDVWAQGDDGPFPGTIWVSDHLTSRIVVFEPNDYGGAPPSCSGIDDPAIDEDADGYDNADEVANATDPCSAADTPADADGDFTSDPLDLDDDDDGLNDRTDRFAVDPENGSTTAVPLRLTWDPGEDDQGGLLGSGFTGLMNDGVTDYSDRFDPAGMTVGSATGTFAIDDATAGTARGLANSQDQGFQVGIDVDPGSPALRVRSRVLAPFGGAAPVGRQAVGIQLGTGGQDDYIAVSLGERGVSFLRELGGSIGARRSIDLTLPGPEAVDLIVELDPEASSVRSGYAIVDQGSAGPVEWLGPPVAVPTAWVDADEGIAVGLLCTSAGSGPPFPAVWDSLKAVASPAGNARADRQR